MMKFKNSNKSIRRWIFALLMYYIFAIPMTTNAQSKLNVGIGADLNELYNISIRYQAEQMQYALGIGTLTDEYENRISVSASMYYHFDGISNLTNRRLWYGRVSLIYNKQEREFSQTENNSLFFGIRVGRDFNITKRLGINTEIGLRSINILKSYNLYSDEFSILFGGGIWLFYRL